MVSASRRVASWPTRSKMPLRRLSISTPPKRAAGISADQGDGDRDGGLQAGGHPVDRGAEGERHDERGDADRDQHQQQRQDDAQLQPRLARRPEIGEEPLEDLQARLGLARSFLGPSVASFAMFVAR